MWLRRIYEFLCVHSNLIWKGRNCRDHRPSHLIFRKYFRLFWFSRSCVVVAYCNRRMCSSNVQGFVSTVSTLYEEEEEDYAPLYRNRRMRTSIFTSHSCVTLRYSQLSRKSKFTRWGHIKIFKQCYTNDKCHLIKTDSLKYQNLFTWNILVFRSNFLLQNMILWGTYIIPIIW